MAGAALNLDDLTARVELAPFPISLKCGFSFNLFSDAASGQQVSGRGEAL